MKPHEKLALWRKKEKELSGRQLSDLLTEKMAADYPDGFPRGVKVSQPDVVDAEQGKEFYFNKVTAAIYKYLDVPEGYFGAYEVITVEKIEAAEGEAEKWRTRTMELQEELLQANERVTRLQQERYELLHRVLELEQEMATLRPAASPVRQDRKKQVKE